MAPITAQSLTSPSGLTVSHRVRFTQEQDRLLHELMRLSRRPISSCIRDIVVSWAVNTVNEEADQRDQDPPIDVRAMVDELLRLAELEAAGE